jgi:hypothetical protein
LNCNCFQLIAPLAKCVLQNVTEYIRWLSMLALCLTFDSIPRGPDSVGRNDGSFVTTKHQQRQCFTSPHHHPQSQKLFVWPGTTHREAPSMESGERNPTFRVTLTTISPVTRPHNPIVLINADTPVHLQVPGVVFPRDQKGRPFPPKMNSFLPPCNTLSLQPENYQLVQES